jgi:hypothetical protein
MKTIEQAAIEESKLKEGFDMEEEKYYQSNKVNVYESFKKGVEFAQRWIPVEEELPEIKEVVLISINIDGTIICYSGYTTQTLIKDNLFVAYGKKNPVKPTHWRPIERI